MKKLMFAAVAALSMGVYAGDTAEASGYYDVTLATKRLAYVDKVVSKTFKTTPEATAYDQYAEYMASVTNLPGYKFISGGITADTEKSVSRISVKYSIYLTKKDGSLVTKLVSDSIKGVYNAGEGKVYLWDMKKKVVTEQDDAGSLVEGDKAKKGFVAYEVPLAMHNQFVATDDGKAAGGFIGGTATADDGTALDFAGLTAYGTGTLKGEELQTVAGNVAMKNPSDLKYGAFGTWKLQKDAKSTGAINTVLRNKGCVELFLEKDAK